MKKIKKLTMKLVEKVRQMRSPYPIKCADWKTASEMASGFVWTSSSELVTKAFESVLLGQGVYQRDGSFYVEPPAKYTLRRHLKEIVEERSIVVDFGGGVGGTWINNRDIFPAEWQGKYCVIEQEEFCLRGRKLAHQYALPIAFESSLSDLTWNPDIVIFSGVLQFIEDWKRAVSEALKLMPSYIVIDRTPLTLGDTEIYVHEWIYDRTISYPWRIANKHEFLSAFPNYEVIDEWNSDFDADDHKGFLMKRI